MELSSTNASALSRLFSTRVYRELGEKGRSPLFARLLSAAGLLQHCSPSDSLCVAFDAAYLALTGAPRRDEYVYRAALTHNILLGQHSLRTASLLTEFRAGECKADLAILNGTSTVYEIKSERDSLTRLAKQLENYRKVFAKTYVIAAQQFLHEVERITSPEIGIMTLERNGVIRTIRAAVDLSDRVCPATIFGSLRQSEAVEVLDNLKVNVPCVPNTMLHAAMVEVFTQLSPSAVHREMVKVLKKTRSLAPLAGYVGQLPPSLQPTALGVSLHPKYHSAVLKVLQTPIGEAITWAH